MFGLLSARGKIIVKQVYLSRYHTQHCTDSSRTWIRLETSWDVCCKEIGENWPRYKGTVLYFSHICTVSWYICFDTRRFNAFIIQHSRSRPNQYTKHLNNERKWYARLFQKTGLWSEPTGLVGMIYVLLAPVGLSPVQIYTVLKLCLIMYLIPEIPWYFGWSRLSRWMMSALVSISLPMPWHCKEPENSQPH